MSETTFEKRLGELETPFEQRIAELVASAESVVDQCLIPVPTGPLVFLSAACSALENDETDARYDSEEEEHPIWALASVCEDVEWGFWPEHEYGSRQAIADPGRIQQLADALAEYRKAIGEGASA